MRIYFLSIINRRDLYIKLMVERMMSREGSPIPKRNSSIITSNIMIKFMCMSLHLVCNHKCKFEYKNGSVYFTVVAEAVFYNDGHPSGIPDMRRDLSSSRLTRTTHNRGQGPLFR